MPDDISVFMIFAKIKIDLRVLPECYLSTTYRFSTYLTISVIEEKPRKIEICVVLICNKKIEMLSL